MPNVSVVIPAYNSEAFIAQAIQSALDQSYKDIEIIVVDDGSTDGTEAVVRSFQGLVAYYRQENRGAGVARTLGVERANGEWIAFLDSDDVWYPDKLALQLEEAQRHQDCAFFYSDLDAVDEAGHVIVKSFLKTKTERRKRKRKAALDAVVFNLLPFPYPSTVLLKRSLFLLTGGFSATFSGNYHEDFEFFARVAHQHPLHFIPQSLVRYRVLPSQTKDHFRSVNWPILLNHLWQMWSHHPEKQAILLAHYSQYFSNRGKILLRLGNYREARKYFRIGFYYQPWHWRNLRRWGASYLPPIRELYRLQKKKPSGSARST
jgi:glycosyltransferase involved in cell wall biosynthesis